MVGGLRVKEHRARGGDLQFMRLRAGLRLDLAPAGPCAGGKADPGKGALGECGFPLVQAEADERVSDLEDVRRLLDPKAAVEGGCGAGHEGVTRLSEFRDVCEKGHAGLAVGGLRSRGPLKGKARAVWSAQGKVLSSPSGAVHEKKHQLVAP